MYPYRIRLRGPWDYEPLARSLLKIGETANIVQAPLPPPGRMTMPCRWGEGGLEGFAGRVRFTRAFGAPARLDAHERLWLMFGGAETDAEVRLNGQVLGSHSGNEPFEFEVTRLIQPRNTLQVDVTSATENGGLWGEVALEVRCPAFLRDVRFWSTVRGDQIDLHAAGQVVGEAHGPLELYLLCDGRAVARSSVQATPDGHPFQLGPAPVAAHRGAGGVEDTVRLYKVRIDLVCGSVIWYGLEQMMSLADDAAP
jgi:hypothetical protein